MSPHTHAGPPRPELAELGQIAAELQRLEDTRRWLLARRAVLLAELAHPGPPRAGAASAVPGPARAQPPAAPGGPHGRPEISRRTVAYLLLGAGGLLVAIAAAIFTAANWSSIGAAGRAAILLATSAIVLAAPWPLARRGLAATAEAVAAVGLALTIADAVLVARLFSVPVHGLLSASLACLVMTALWAVYGALAPVRGPRLAAIGLAQFPAPLAAGAWPPYPAAAVALALALTAAADLGLAAWAGHHQFRPERLAARAAAATLWWGALTVTAMNVAVTEVAASPDVAQIWLLAGVLVVIAVMGLLGVPFTRAWNAVAGPVAGISGTAIAVGLALPATAVLAGPWRVAAFAIGGAAVASVSFRRPPPASGRGVPRLGTLLGRALNRRPGYLAGGGLAVLAASAVAMLPAAITGLLYPLAWAGQGWPASWPARAGLSPGQVWDGSPVTPAVLIMMGLACWLVPGRLVLDRLAPEEAGPGPAAPDGAPDEAAPDEVVRAAPRTVRAGWRVAALAAAGLAAGSVPVAAGLPGWAAMAFLTAAAAGLVAAGCWMSDRVAGWAACLAGLMVAASAGLWSLAGPAATVAELAVLCAGLAAAGMTARTTGAALVVTAGALAALTGLAIAAALASGLSAGEAAFAVLGVAATAAGLAALLRHRRPGPALILEAGAAPVAVVAVAMAARYGGPGPVEIVLAASGALCCAMALRPGRRALVWAGLVLGEMALWVWLVTGGVRAPEPYTLPAAALMIAAGWRHACRSPRASSWLCYGPGLALLLVPSLAAVWQGHGWTRPLVLGLAAALISLAGARARLAAPLLLGAGVAILDAGHELASPARHLMAVVPHWVPIAVIGTLLLVVGATYESRLRDLARLRAALARLR